MKLLTNKQFQGEINKALEPIIQENEKLREIISKKEYSYLEKYDELKELTIKYENTIDELITKNNKLIEDKKLLFGAKGGLTKYVHRLEKELKQVKDDLEIANKKLSERFILKELKPQKAKNTQVMKTKNGSKTSKIIKKVKEND